MLPNKDKKDSVFDAVADAGGSASEPGINIANYMLLSTPYKDCNCCHLCHLRRVEDKLVRCSSTCGFCDLAFHTYRSFALHHGKMLRKLNPMVYLPLCEVSEVQTFRNPRIFHVSCTD